MQDEIEVKEKSGEFHTLPVGNYQATCYDIWDIGIQKGEYKGIPNATHKIVIAFEVNKRIQSTDEWNGKRFTIPKFYTLSLGKKSNLRHDLTSWRGKEFTEAELKGFKLSNILGANCFLNIIHGDNGKPKIAAIASLPEGIEKITAEAKETVPEWIKKFQAKAISKDEADAVREEAKLMDEPEAGDGTDSGQEIPF